MLDQYFWRIGDRTWRGKATNACLDRVARELRSNATRNTAVTIQEVRSANASRMPLIRIGSRAAFSNEGLTPISSHPAKVRRGSEGPPNEIAAGAAVRIAALFHDLGKATVLFQKKLLRALGGEANKADPIRHELYSAIVWDHLFGHLADEALVLELANLTPAAIDEACHAVKKRLFDLHHRPDAAIGAKFFTPEGTLTHLIGFLILTHHRLPEGGSSHLSFLSNRHVNYDTTLKLENLNIADGIPFWHEDWWVACLQRETKLLSPEMNIVGTDIALRASLMFADHLGSAAKQSVANQPDHLANTMEDTQGGKNKVAADSLSKHVQRVYRRTRGAFDMLHRYRERFPALSEKQIPTDVIFPQPSTDVRFIWQANAAQSAREMCEQNEGGFFACLLAGTGTGKTRAAPTILANAAFGDTCPERRYFRMSLALGLRVLATQAAQEYVGDLGFRKEDVSVLVGQQPVRFVEEQELDDDGSESLITLPEWLRVQSATGGVPEEGDEREADWLRSLSINTDRGLPAFCDMVLEKAGKNGVAGRRLLEPPIMVGTIDHLMGVASPVNSRFLIQSVRLLTSDLVLDEIDQFGGEDLAAIGRLVFQAATAGRRVIIMSATLTADITETLYTAYQRGWSDFARSRNLSKHVNILCCGDFPKSCVTNRCGGTFSLAFSECRSEILKGIHASQPVRLGEILPKCESWPDLLSQIDEGCSRMHDLNSNDINGFRVSVGLVRMTRIAHTASLAAQLPSGDLRGRLRVKLCLHSQFPLLHRSWIETQLKKALTRKGPDPEAGVRFLCHSENLFNRASAFGSHEIEIVVITSPVIETGNDLDFDYAVLDPISTRSIIQSAGRVRRHRPPNGKHFNVLILGRSPIAIQSGTLSNPGVETRPAPETQVARISLEDYEGRFFRDLAGDENFSQINAAVLLSEKGNVPLRDAEAKLRREMISTLKTSPLGKYLFNLNARLNLSMIKTRKFRRSKNRDIAYVMVGETLQEGEWYVDIAPGTRNSRLSLAVDNNLILSSADMGEMLFSDLAGSAWSDYANRLNKEQQTTLRTLMQVSIPDFGDDLVPSMTYDVFTGFTRGIPEDLFEGLINTH